MARYQSIDALPIYLMRCNLFNTLPIHLARYSIHLARYQCCLNPFLALQILEVLDVHMHAWGRCGANNGLATISTTLVHNYWACQTNECVLAWATLLGRNPCTSININNTGTSAPLPPFAPKTTKVSSGLRPNKLLHLDETPLFGTRPHWVCYATSLTPTPPN